MSETLGFDGTSKAHVDKILQEIFKDKQYKSLYFSDMASIQGNKRLEFIVYDIENNFFKVLKFLILQSSPKQY